MNNPKNVRVYDNGGKTQDRYTLVFMSFPAGNGRYECLGMDEQPYHPLGFRQHGTAVCGRHLGKRIRWEQLPEGCRKAAAEVFVID